MVSEISSATGTVMVGACACGGSCGFFLLQAMLSNKDKIRTEAANWWRQMFMPSSAISLPRQSLSGRLPKSSEQNNCSQ